MSWRVVTGTQALASLAPLPPAALEGVDHVNVPIDGTPVTVLRHDYQTWRTLRARGMVVPSPLCHHRFPGQFTPREHQYKTVDFLLANDRAFVLNGLRTGKTHSAIWAADYLRSVGAVRRVLVVAPLSICEIVWERHLFFTLPYRTRAVLKGTRDRKQQIARDTRLEFLVVNPESLHLLIGHLPEVDLVVVDEFTRFKNQRSRRWRALRDIASRTRLWMMSATPAPQAPTDAYAPVRLVNPERITFTGFRDMTMYKVTQFKWVPRKEADQIIARYMQPAIRFRREDCLEIPDHSVENLEVALTAQQAKHLEHLEQKAALEIEGHQVTAANAAAVLLKMLQVMAGGVYGMDEAGERVVHAVPAEPYYEAVEEVVESAEGPVLVFTEFQAVAMATAQHLADQGYRVETITGARTSGRMAVFDAFQRGELDAIVAVPSTMSQGLDLANGSTVLWATPPFSFETYEQANHRVMGEAQQRKVLILHLVQNALAKELFHRLKSKESLQSAVLKLLEGRLDE